MAYNSSYTGDTIDTAIGKANNMHPIGYIYITMGTESPASLYGGTWTKLSDGYTLWSASDNIGNTISAGLPNITGSIRVELATGGYPIGILSSGAFYNPAGNNGGFGIINSSVVSFNYSNGNPTCFSATRSSSIYGNSSTVQPPAYKVYMWKRIN